jgi:hypothetical protein
MTDNDTPGEGNWIEMTPVGITSSDAVSPNITLTTKPKAKAIDLGSIDGGIVLLALVLGVVGLVSVVAIIYLTRPKDKV